MLRDEDLRAGPPAGVHPNHPRCRFAGTTVFTRRSVRQSGVRCSRIPDQRVPIHALWTVDELLRSDKDGGASAAFYRVEQWGRTDFPRVPCQWGVVIPKQGPVDARNVMPEGLRPGDGSASIRRSKRLDSRL